MYIVELKMGWTQTVTGIDNMQTGTLGSGTGSNV
jgi:hypothetical protein